MLICNRDVWTSEIKTKIFSSFQLKLVYSCLENRNNKMLDVGIIFFKKVILRQCRPKLLTIFVFVVVLVVIALVAVALVAVALVVVACSYV